MKKQVKIILFGAFVAIVLVSVLYQKFRPLEISADEVTKTSLTDSFREEGLVKSDDNYSVYVPYDGKIKMIVPEGSVVNKGELLLMMDDEMLLTQKNQLSAQIESLRGQQRMGKASDNQIEIAQIAVDSAKNAFENASVNYDRAQQLYQSGGISKAELEQAESAYQDAQNHLQAQKTQLKELQDQRSGNSGSNQFYGGQISAIEAQLKDIQDKLQRKKVYAPTDGIVKLSVGKSGEYAQAIRPALEITSPKNLIISCDVLIENIPALRIGQQVQIIQKTYAEDLYYSGEIIHIDDFAHQKISSLGLNEQRVEVKVKLSEKNSLLKDGYGADVVFDTFHKENILAVSKTSYFEEADKFYVWKIEGNKATKSEISLGYIGSHKAEVLEGLAENDRIVSDPNNKSLANGVRVKIKS